MCDNRDSKGRFIEVRQETPEEKAKRIAAIVATRQANPSYQARRNYPQIFNSWRALQHTVKGKSIGCTTSEWKKFINFFNDVVTTWKPGLEFHRIDTSKPFSKDNFTWMTHEQASTQDRKNLVYLDYKGEKLTLKDAAIKYDQPYNALRQRYHKGKNYTVEQIIFGKSANHNNKKVKQAIPNSQKERDKASKMIAQYKLKDKKKGLSICDFDIDWMISNILRKPCIYCGDTHRIGADRIDNEKGHTKDNVVPCCYECNCTRNNNFSFEEMKILGKIIRQIKQNRKND